MGSIFINKFHELWYLIDELKLLAFLWRSKCAHLVVGDDGFAFSLQGLDQNPGVRLTESGLL